jgi:signal recognition particle subunit SRP19
MADIERALHSCRITFRREAKSHPAYWSKREGRLIVTFTGKKTELISHVAAALKKTK